MKYIKFSVSDQVFVKCPGYIRAVIVAKIKNSPSEAEVSEMLQNEIRMLAQKLTSDTIAAHPHVLSWRYAFKEFNTNPTDFRPSFEALIRRALKSAESIHPINMAVDLGNIIAIKHQVGIGVHPINDYMTNIELRCAIGNESFEDFSTGNLENPKLGEVILAQKDQVFTRRWIWRQSKSSIITRETDAVFINIDFLSPFNMDEACSVVDDTCLLFNKFCTSSSAVLFITKENPEIMFDMEAFKHD